MYRILLIVLMMIFNNGCGTTTDLLAVQLSSAYDRELMVYVDRVMAHFPDTQLNTEAIYRIEFIDQQEKVTLQDGTKAVALCHSPKSGIWLPQTRYILVVRGQWDVMSDIEKLWIMAHELGHCQWNYRSHSKHRGDVMYPFFPADVNLWTEDTTIAQFKQELDAYHNRWE